MGYRLWASNKDETIVYYGTKHYGYSFLWGYRTDKECLGYASYRYLKYLKKVDGYEAWFDLDQNKITLTAKQFKHFIKLYSFEVETDTGYCLLDQKDIKKLLEDKGDKFIEWG